MKRATDEQVQILKDKVHGLHARHGRRLVVLYKDEKWDVTWWLKVIKWFVAFVGLFSKKFEQNWYNNYTIAVGNYLVFPSRKRYSDWSLSYVYKIVRHEYIHMVQYYDHPLLWPLSYIALLPTVLSMRAYWEFPAYVETMKAHYELGGTIDDGYVEMFLDYFTGPSYLWMFPFEDFMWKKFIEARNRILQGTI